MSKTRHLILGLAWNTGFRANEFQAVDNVPYKECHDGLLMVALNDPQIYEAIQRGFNGRSKLY